MPHFAPRLSQCKLDFHILFTYYEAGALTPAFHFLTLMDLSEFDIDFLSQRLSDNPQSPLFARLADLYLSKNQSSEALKLCETGVQAYSSYATGYVVLGKCYLALNQNSKAKLAFTQALHFSPFNQVARRLLSEILHTVDESPEAAGEETVAVSLPVAEAQPTPSAQIVTSVVEEEVAPAPSLQEPEPVVEDIAVAPALEEAAQEVSQPEEVQIVESPVVGTAQAPVQLDEIQIVESPAENVVSAPIVKKVSRKQFNPPSLNQPYLPRSRALTNIYNSTLPSSPQTT